MPGQEVRSSTAAGSISVLRLALWRCKAATSRVEGPACPTLVLIVCPKKSTFRTLKQGWLLGTVEHNIPVVE